MSLLCKLSIYTGKRQRNVENAMFHNALADDNLEFIFLQRSLFAFLHKSPNIAIFEVHYHDYFFLLLKHFKNKQKLKYFS